MLEKREAYKYKAIKNNKEIVEGIVYAFDKKEAFSKIRDRM